MQFPLYEYLEKEIKNNKYELDDNINLTIGCNLRRKDCEYIYLIILHHYILESNITDNYDMCKPIQKNRAAKENKKIYSLPHKGITQPGGKGAKYYVSTLPSNLKQIIACYVSMIT